MLFNRSLPKLLIVAIALSGLAACASTGKTVPDKPATAVIKADSTINTDSSGQAKPVVVVLYQLKDVNSFNSAEFFSLYQNPNQTLGPDYITSQQAIIAPGETKKLSVALKPDTRFIGVVAAFQQLNTAAWQASVPVGKKKHPTFKLLLTKAAVQFAKGDE